MRRLMVPRPLVLPLIVGLAAGSARAEPPPSRLTVEDAVRIALSNHPNLAAARALREAAAARTREAWSLLLPALTGSFTYNPQTANAAFTPAFQRALGGNPSAIAIGIDRNLTPGTPDYAASAAQATPCVIPPVDPATGARPMTPTPCFAIPRVATPNSADMFNFFSAGVGVLWTVFDFGRTYYGARAVAETEESTRLAAEATGLQVKLDVRAAFFTALAADALVDVARESVATQARHLEQMKGFVEVGTRTKVDLAQAQADLASATLTLARARGQRDAARATLHLALGLEDWRDLELAPPPPEANEPPPSEKDPLDEAVANRPEPRQFLAQARSAAEIGKSIRGAWFPQLQLSLGPSFAGTDITSLTPNFQVALTLGYPIGGFNPFYIHAQGREARANERIALAQAQQARNQIRQETATAEAQLRAAREAVAAADTLLVAARERRELANGRFEAGLGTVLELEDAELAYVNARAQQVQASYEAWTARAHLDRALGR